MASGNELLVPVRIRALVLRVAVALSLLLAQTSLAGALADVVDRPLPCAVSLEAFDAAGVPLFRTVAAVLRDRAVAAPLQTLERRGARWEDLRVEGRKVAGVFDFDTPGDLVYLDVPGLEACPAAGVPASQPPAPLEPSAAVRIVRERIGYRPAVVGGRVEREIDLPDGRGSVLVHLLDDRGATPGLLFDEAGRLVGSLAPAPAGSDPSYAVVIPAIRAAQAGDVIADAPPEAPRVPARAAIAERSTPSVLESSLGRLSQALLDEASGRTDEALREIEAVIRVSGESAPLLIERGALAFNAGRIASAVGDLTRASELDPHSHLARYDLGMALGATGRYGDAARAFASARDILPSHGRTRFQLALALKAARESDAARHEYEALERLDPTMARELKLLIGF